MVAAVSGLGATFMRELTLLPREAKENNREYAYRVLRENIITCNLPPGEVLNENAVAEMLASSRTPVREALFTLRMENMVEVRPQSASIVSLIDLNLLRQGVMMQVMVETEIMESLCGNLDETLIHRWRDNLAGQREAVASPDKTRHYLALDDEFHRLAYVAARKENLYRVTKTLSSQLDRLRYLLLLEGRIEYKSGFAEHKELFIRLLSGMRKGLAELYLPHRLGVEKHIPAVAAKYPEYFRTDAEHDGRMDVLAGLMGCSLGAGEGGA